MSAPFRLWVGALGVVVTALSVRTDRVGPREARLFAAVNDLPDWFFVPTWSVMQLGTVGAAPVAAGAAYVSGDRALARRMLLAGSGAWALSKILKRNVGRPRPAMLLPTAHSRGREASGLGYLSGHAGVAVALGAAALSRTGRRGRAVILAVVPLVGVARIYVGAHLPLDVAGGASLGLALEAALSLLQDRRERPS